MRGHTILRKLAFVAIALGIVGCAPTTTSNSIAINDAGKVKDINSQTQYWHLLAFIPNADGASPTYHWHTVAYPSPEEVLTAVRADMDVSVKALTTSEAAYGTLLLYIPDPIPYKVQSAANSAAASEVTQTWWKFSLIINDARLAGLSKSGLFSDIKIDHGAPFSPQNQGHDYVIWQNDETWYIRYGDNNPMILSDANANDIDSWIDTVASDVKKLDQIGREPKHMADVDLRDSGIVYNYNGLRFHSAHQTLIAARADVDTLLKTVEPISPRLGGRAEVFIATGAQLKNQIAVRSPEQSLVLSQFFKQMALNILNFHVKRIKQSKLFDSVDTQYADVTEAPLGAYDFVLWQDPSDFKLWKYRLKIPGRTDQPVHVLDLKNIDWYSKDWLAAVYEQLKKASSQ